MTQLFKMNVPKNIVMELITTYFYYNDIQNNYILNKSVYKKLILFRELSPFLQKIKPYYFLSKQYYVLKKPLTYSNFATIIRQLCKYLNICIKSKIKYDKSTYEIIYNIKLELPYTSSCDTSACSSATSSACPSPRK